MNEALTPDQARAIASKSTATEAQTAKLLALLEIRPRHTYELRQLGISHPAGRVQNLEEEGCVIGSSRITVVDENGFTHPGVALYELISRPAKQSAATEGGANATA